MIDLAGLVLENYCPNPTHRVTLTSVNSSGLGKAQSKISAANIATKKFLHHLDTACWKHGHRRKGYQVACIATVEGLGSWENWHVHLSLRAPDHVSFYRFYDLVVAATKRVSAFGSQIRIKPYDAPEWVEYCFKTGPDCWLVECTRSARP